jgi:hypothetical protein
LIPEQPKAAVRDLSFKGPVKLMEPFVMDALVWYFLRL